MYSFASIPIRSTCTMWPNSPVTEQVGTAFNLYNVAELSSNRTGGNGAQVETENEKFTVMCSSSPQNLEFGHFTLLFAEHGEKMYQN